MTFDADLFRGLFQNCISKLTAYLTDILEKPGVKETSTLLMVGGFSECLLMQEAVLKAFPKVKVVIPKEASLAVVKGAVMLGHMFGMASKQNKDDVSSDDIANLSTCSDSHQQGIHEDQTRNMKYKSSGEEKEEFLSTDYVEMKIQRHDEDTTALQTRLENQMTLKADVKRTPSDDELFTLSRKLDKLNKGWWLLAKLLGLSDDKIDEMEHGGGDTVRQYYKMLTAWKTQNTGQEKGSVGYLLKQLDEATIDPQVTVDVFGN